VSTGHGKRCGGVQDAPPGWVGGMVLKATSLLIISSLAFPTSVLAQKPEIQPVRVHVFTAPTEGGFVDVNSKQRTDSVKDLQRNISKKKTAIVVEDQSLADITLEIVGREHIPTGDTTSRGFTTLSWGIRHHTETTANKLGTVHIALTVGSYSTPINGECGETQLIGCWGTAAKDAAGKIEKWIKDNHTRIPRK